MWRFSKLDTISAWIWTAELTWKDFFKSSSFHIYQKKGFNCSACKMKKMHRAVIWKKQQTNQRLYTNKCKQKAPHSFCQLWGRLQFHAMDVLRRDDDLLNFTYVSKGHAVKCPTVTSKSRWDNLRDFIDSGLLSNLWSSHTLPQDSASLAGLARGAGTFAAFTVCCRSGSALSHSWTFLDISFQIARNLFS